MRILVIRARFQLPHDGSRSNDRGLSPTVLRHGPYRLFFFSREEERMHVHVHAAEGEAKFWLEPKVELAENHGLPPRMLQVAYKLVQANESTIRQAWKAHFGR